MEDVKRMELSAEPSTTLATRPFQVKSIEVDETPIVEGGKVLTTPQKKETFGRCITLLEGITNKTLTTEEIIAQSSVIAGDMGFYAEEHLEKTSTTGDDENRKWSEAAFDAVALSVRAYLEAFSNTVKGKGSESSKKHEGFEVKQSSDYDALVSQVESLSAEQLGLDSEDLALLPEFFGKFKRTAGAFVNIFKRDKLVRWIIKGESLDLSVPTKAQQAEVYQDVEAIAEMQLYLLKVGMKVLALVA